MKVDGRQLIHMYGPLLVDRTYTDLLADDGYEAANRYLRSTMQSRDVADAIAHRRWREALKFYSPNRWPELLACWVDEHALSADELREIIPAIWVASVLPVCPALPMEVWVDLWRAIGFYSNLGRRRPLHEITVYRGTLATAGVVLGAEIGMSWTTSRDYAREFVVARGAPLRGGALRQMRSGVVWQLDAPPAAVLAVLEPDPALEPLLAYARPRHAAAVVQVGLARRPARVMNEIVLDPSYVHGARMVERT